MREWVNAVMVRLNDQKYAQAYQHRFNLLETCEVLLNI